MTSSNPPPERVGVVLIGHGAPATDCPPQLIGELMSLEWRANGSPHGHGGPPGGPRAGDLARRAEELDAAIRDWPRRDDNDPYKAGLERLAGALRPLLPTGCFAIGYNEFCRPSIAEAVAQVVEQGATRVLVIPSMLTPGGVHSEVDIPQALNALRASHPHVTIDYVWPFDLQQVAALLAVHITRSLNRA
jgi:sirohydrochlorin cobaltochelatase